MTEEQKEILIAKMLDAPASLTDEELESIITDDELRDIHRVSSIVRGACIKHPEIDMEEEWKRFSLRMCLKPTRMRRIMRVAAVLLGVMFACGIVVRLIDYYASPNTQSLIVKMEQTLNSENTPPIIENLQISDCKADSIYKSTPQENQTVISKRTLAKTKIAKPKIEQLPEATDIDVDDYLRIYQARIDNDLAMQEAEIYREEYDNVMAILYSDGKITPEIDNMIRNLTMQ